MSIDRRVFLERLVARGGEADRWLGEALLVLRPASCALRPKEMACLSCVGVKYDLEVLNRSMVTSCWGRGRGGAWYDVTMDVTAKARS